LYSLNEFGASGLAVLDSSLEDISVVVNVEESIDVCVDHAISRVLDHVKSLANGVKRLVNLSVAESDVKVDTEGCWPEGSEEVGKIFIDTSGGCDWYCRGADQSETKDCYVFHFIL